MPPNTFTQWQQPIDSYWGVGSNTPQPEPIFRDALDKMRAAYRRVPQAEYPDGYLGTIRTRREDKIDQYVQGTRLTQRNYQRGIHKGERIDPQDYIWPANVMTPDMGLRLEAQGMKWSPRGTTNELLAAKGKMPVPRGAQGLITVTNPKRVDQLRRLIPSWNP